MDFILPNRERFQRVVILFPFVAESLRTATRLERERELGNSEDALAAEFHAPFFAHPRQKAEVVLLGSLLPASALELTLCAMPVQDKIRRRRVG